MKKSIVALFCLAPLCALSLMPRAQAASGSSSRLSQDLDALGSDQAILNRAQRQTADQKVEVVQKRIVDRKNRFEMGARYGVGFGVSSYYQSQTIGGNVDFHINPRISFGLRYDNFSNNLTSDGRSAVDTARRKKAAGDVNYNVPDLDAPKQSVTLVGNFYPIYGKLNLFNATIVQFDLYGLAGYGQIEKEKGWGELYTAGGGVGLWLTQHISMRGEVRWQRHNETVYTGTRALDYTVATLGMGVLL